MPQLGRRIQTDSRNLPARLLLKADEPIKTRMWSMFHKELDQGAASTCVGHAGKHFMLMTPVIQTTPTKSPTAVELYLEAAQLDIWPENDDGNLQWGTSVLALMKALKNSGIINSYMWTNSVTELARWISKFGPAVIGVNWYDSMFTTDKGGCLNIGPDDKIAGGHAIAVRGWNAKRGLFRLVNSWGPNWGDGGQCWMSGEMMERLMAEDGEIALPTEVRVVVPPIVAKDIRRHSI